MTTSFSSLPIVDLSPLQSSSDPNDPALVALSNRLYDVFATTGFAYLVNSPLSFTPGDVFSMAGEFFSLPQEAKMSIAKKSFNPQNSNTYRGYFPTQPDLATDNLKEGFEIGPPNPPARSKEQANEKINLAEPNIWPSPQRFTSQERLESLYSQMQALSAKLLSLLALSLDKPSSFFDSYLAGSVSTLRLLHYPTSTSSSSSQHLNGEETTNINTREVDTDSALGSSPPSPKAQLSCTPHTDSGILTLLHQDPTGGLEVQNASGDWVAAPYIPGSIVVNIGDLMAKVSGGRFVATMHRVRKPQPQPQPQSKVGAASEPGNGIGRLSVPFFFEPGEDCLVRGVDGGEGVVYGRHVREKMKGWVEFRDL